MTIKNIIFKSLILISFININKRKLDITNRIKATLSPESKIFTETKK